MVDKTLRMNLLFDFYGQLLTDRQRDFFEMYYADDLSLGEIAAHFAVSRQAVYDIIRRSGNSLENFESRLGLYARHEKSQARLEELSNNAKALQLRIESLTELSAEDRATLLALGQRIHDSVRAIQAEE